MTSMSGSNSGDDSFRSRFHRFPLPTFTWRKKGEDFILHDFNQAALAITNGGIAGLVGTKATSFFRDRADIVDDIFTCFEGKVDFTTETDYTFVTTDETKRLRVFCVYVPPDMVMVHIEDISDVHSATKVMIESEQKYKALFNSSTDAVIVHDFSGRFLDVNPTACQQLGYTREEILELRATDVYSQEILALFRGYQNQLTKEGYISFETEYHGRDGTRIPVDVRTGIIDYGDRKAVLTIARDITEHKLYQAELKKSKESMQLALVGADIAVWDWDIASGKVNRSPKWAEMLGYTPEEVESSIHVWEDLIHPDDMQGALDRLKAHLEGQAEAYISEHRLKTAGGQWMWVLEKGRIAERDRNGKPLRLTGTHVDVTERRKTEEALVHSEIRYRTLFDSARDSILVACDGKFIDSNRTALDMFGSNRDQLIGREVKDFLPILQPDGLQSIEYLTGFTRRALSGTPQLFEFKLKTLRDNEFDAEVSLNMIIIEGRECLQFVIRDITERKKAEARLFHQNEFQKLISLVSTYFINIAAERFDEGIQNTLRSLGEFTRADRAFLFLLDDDSNLVVNTFEWVRDRLKKVLKKTTGQISLEDYPWCRQKLLSFETVHIPDTEELPEEAAAEREGFRKMGTRSLIATPMAPGGKLLGFVGLNMDNEVRDWQGDNALFLISISDIVAHSLERKSFEERMQDLATTDSLTGAFNRLRIMDSGDEEVTRALRYDRSLAVLMIDIDYFKYINDTYGHLVGDDVLKQLTRRCFHILRDTDIFGRYGGDEFVAILPESEAEKAFQVAERLRTEVEELKIQTGSSEIQFTISIGLTQLRDEEKFEETLNRADQALYHAKRSGRNRVVTEI